MGDGEVIIEVIIWDRRPPRPAQDLCTSKGLNDMIWNLLQDCWQKDPSKRPSMVQVYNRLVEIAEPANGLAATVS